MDARIVLVTGGSSGIGKATALAFAQEGATVVIASRRKTKANQTLKEIHASNGTALWIETDVSEASQVKALIATIMKEFGRLDVAFNNAGSGGKGALTADISELSWHKTIQGYLTSTWYCLKYQIPAMLASGGGVIVNNASVDGVRGYPFPMGSAYAAAKHGVIGLTKSAAKEYIRQGIRINAVCPGWISTPAVTKMMQRDEAKAAAILASEPIGRLGLPEEVANLVVWLCSDIASFMVGTHVVVDGGYLA